MSEWATYSLTDLLMFSKRTYFRLFATYNNDIWPMQLLAAAIGIAVVAAVLRGGARPAKFAACLLGLCWLWVGLVFHLRYYATINTAGAYFAAAFVVQGMLLLWLGLRGGGLAASTPPGALRGALLLFTLSGLAGYPLLAPATGRPLVQAEVFGVAPDPTAIVTLGALALAGRRWLLWPIPLLWCATSAATLATMWRVSGA